MTDREKLVELLGDCKWWGTLDDMADHLIANGVTFQQWIPVTDRLPEEDGDYLTVNDCNSVLQFTFFKDGKKTGNYDLFGEKDIWCDYDSEYGFFQCLDITHWMPLPTPPED